MRLAGMISASCETLLPCLCLHCGEPVGGDRGALCQRCWTIIVPHAGGSCPRCGWAAEGGLDPCLRCQSETLPQSGTVSWGEYDGALRSAVLALKAGHDELAKPLGRRLSARIAVEDWPDQIDLLTYIPSHPIRRIRHGWSAAACLSREVAKEIGQSRRSLLRRHGLVRQTGRGRPERLRLPRSVFSCPTSLEGRVVLVIDDVSTTGTTIRRAAEVLLLAGADAVYCAVMATTPDSRRVT